MDREIKPPAMLGDFPELDRIKDELDRYAVAALKLNEHHEFEMFYILAAIRRTLSLIVAFRHSIEIGNEQMAVTLLRLNLDTVARFYALFWADETKGMTAETFARQVFEGKQINHMKLRNQKNKAQDTWLISQIEPLAPWIRDVYTNTSGAIHFSDFHMKRLLQQNGNQHTSEDGGLRLRLKIGGTEEVQDSNQYSILKQAFTHICLLLLCAIQDRCGLLERPSQ